MPAELTPAGHSFLPVAQEAIRTFYAAREALRPSHEPGLIRFAALHTLTVTFFPLWLKALEASGGAFNTSLLPDRGGIEANLDALVGDEADFFLTYAHPEVPFHLDRGQFASLTVAHDRLVPLAAPRLSVAGSEQPGLNLIDRAVAQPRLAIPFLSYGFNSFFGVALSRLFHHVGIPAARQHLALPDRKGLGDAVLPAAPDAAVVHDEIGMNFGGHLQLPSGTAGQHRFPPRPRWKVTTGLANSVLAKTHAEFAYLFLLNDL